MLRRYWPGLVALLLVLLFLWWLRPIFHGFVMFFYTSPIVWFPPIAILAIGFGIRRFRGSKLSKRDLELLTGREGDDPLSFLGEDPEGAIGSAERGPGKTFRS